MIKVCKKVRSTGALWSVALVIGALLPNAGELRAAAANIDAKTTTRNAADASLNAAIVKILSRHFHKDGPGAAVLITDNGVVKHMQCYGMADAAAEKPITPNSVFDLASMSKQFTAAAVLLLVSDGKFALSDPVRKVLPDLKVPAKGREVTVADLVYHLSGLANYTSDDWDGTDEEFQKLTPSTHLQWINHTKSHRAPGVKWEYNNSGYVLLALIVERTSGMSYADFVKTRLFEPAGMSSSVVHDKLALHLKVPNLVQGYKVKKGEASKSSEWTQITGDGNILATIADIARWDNALRHDMIFTAAQKKLAWSSGRLDDGSPIDNDGDGYGFGLNTDLKLGMVWHNGSWMGTSTCIRRYLKSGITIAVLSNDEKADANAIVNEIDIANDEAKAAD